MIRERDIRRFLYAFAPRRDVLARRVPRVVRRLSPLRRARRTGFWIQLLGAIAIMVFPVSHSCGVDLAAWALPLAFPLMMIGGAWQVIVQWRARILLTRRWPLSLARSMLRQDEHLELSRRVLAAGGKGELASWFVLFEHPMVRRPMRRSIGDGIFEWSSAETIFMCFDPIWPAVIGGAIAFWIGLGILISAMTGLSGSIGQNAIPLMACAAPISIIVLGVWEFLVARERMHQIAEMLIGHSVENCTKCGYDLRGCEALVVDGIEFVRCPECGRQQTRRLVRVADVSLASRLLSFQRRQAP